MEFQGMDVLSAAQFDRDGLDKLYALAHRMRPIARREVRSQVLSGFILGSYFFEESTRTRLSSETAFSRLGGGVVTITDMRLSSMVKSESYEDAFRVLDSYCDIMVVRTPKEGAAEIAAKYCDVPVINGGDGTREHPTQALTDDFTIREEICKRGIKTIDGLTVAFIGDLKRGRTVHSLLHLLSLYDDMKFIFIAPEKLQMPPSLVASVSKRGFSVVQTDDLAAGVNGADIWYVTRPQWNRDDLNEKEKEEVKKWGSEHRISRDFVEKQPHRPLAILHPLPRNEEIATDTDSLVEAAYFRQSDNGVLVRMAVFLFILGKDKKFV